MTGFARWLLGLVLVVFSVMGTDARAQAAGSTDFDHLRTGFALTGQHAKTRCESCHQNGILKGTPRDCTSCHQSGQRFARGNTVMSANHLPSQQSCDTCHTTKGFGGAKFNHGGVSSGSCQTCHNGNVSTGKTASHVATSASCDSCHRSSGWLPLAAFDHSSVSPGSCGTCHNGNRATGKSAQHIPTASVGCDSCHKSFTGWRPTGWNHSQLPVANQCASCHSGGNPPADGKPANHVPVQGLAAAANCDSCHKGSTSTWANGRLHANVAISSDCASCHTGSLLGAVGKPSTPIHSQLSTCESCHTTSTWAGAKVNHSGYTSATNCASCHNGAAATGKSASHMPSGNANCTSCHSTSAWKPSKWNHTQLSVSGTCATCHSGGYPPADGRSASHIPFESVAATASASCDTCHKAGFNSWTPARLHANANISSGCATCHSGAFLPAVGKPNTAVHAAVTGNCESCHQSTSTWSGAKVDHSGFGSSTNCASCHDGRSATAKPATHMPVGNANCFSCHATSGWRPAKWNHTQVAVSAQCASCHTGGFPPADGRSATHIPVASVSATASANCDTCHKSGYSAWTPARLHSNVTISSACATCHNGAFPPAVGKPATAVHATVTGNCESCHLSTTTWSGAKVDHSSFSAATACASCHDGTAATGKRAGHIPVGTTNCFSCHATSAWVPAKWSHTQVAVAGKCASCHSGGYPPADGRSASHIPYTSVSATASANCDSCHKSGFSAWAPARFHSNVNISTACATCHTGSFAPAVGKPNTAVHATVTGNCESCHKSTSSWSGAKVDHSSFSAATNCSSCHDGSSATAKPASHIPVGSANCFSCHSTTGWTPSKWNHTQVTVASRCATCHTGGYPPADGRSASHIPYTSVSASASANCDACHKSGYGAWTPARFHANFSVSSTCATCHSGGFPPAVGKPNTAVHATVTGNCESCHKSTANWSANVDHSTFNGSTNCASCHNGGSATGKPGTHMPVGSANCFSCHNTSGWTPSKWNHTQLTVNGQCASCHTGGYPPADGKPSNHVPYQSVSVSASANCDACHKGSYSTWVNGKFHSNFTVSSNCATCHTGAYLSAVGKPNTSVHSGVTGNCESCHKSTSSWSANVDHSTFNGSTNCASCHNGSSATGKPGTHMPVGSTNCFSCHNTSGWTPSKWNHTQLTVNGQCASCHTGGYPPADGKPSNHVPYQSVSVSASANCDACHKGSYSTWGNGKFHSNFTVGTSCATCHTGAYLSAVGKPNSPIHAGVTGNCESCHKSTSSWSANVDHSAFNGSTNCANCHNGSTATGKPGNHIPSGSTNCFSCHNTSGWTPSKWNHTQLTVNGQCASCHTGGYPPADGKPANHVPYQSIAVSASANCDACHKGGFSTWGNGTFHSNFSVSANCATCHTGNYLSAVGKPNTPIHAGVTGNCESCHKSTSSWSANVDHSGYNGSTNCASCHNGSTATGKPGNHIPSGSTNCFSCHNTSGWTPSKWNHTQVTVNGQCASCHTGGYPPADGKPSNHVPYQSVSVSASANCDACHKGSYSTWGNGKFHSNFTVSTSCVTCHTGNYLSAVGKPNTPIHAGVTGNCESCHKSTSSWSANVDHSGYNGSTNCASCHNGSTATGKPGNHIPSGSTNCFSCHNTSGWTPSKWNHTQLTVNGQCASCHTGGYPPADGKPSNHVPYQSIAVSASANCDACHKGSYTTWGNGKFHSNFTVSTSCVTCHTGNYLSAVGKPNTPIHAGVTGNCESCHKSTSNWSANVDHSGYNGSTNCASCHNGSTATGKPGNHIPVGATNCYSCHNTTGWTPTKWNHTQVTVNGQCASCHTGGYPPADGKPSNHVPYQSIAVSASANCDACHKGSYSSWGNGKFHSNFVVSTNCSTCHTGNYLNAVGKPNTPIHAGVTGNCESCHKSTSNWSANVDHSTFNGSTNCASCHNGSTATGKPGNHIPVGATNCYSCHNTTGWTPTKWNHTQVTVNGQCASCHTGGYPPADGKPANHVPYQSIAVSSSANCDACHKGSYSTWGNGKFHSNFIVSTNCSTCHTGSYLSAVGKPNNPLHSGVTGNCESCHKSTTDWGNVSYAHSPANAVGTGTCDNCHNGSTATGKPATHIPVPAGSARCDSCHKSQASWSASVTMNHSVVTGGACKSCHNGGYTSEGPQGALGKPANHIPESQLLNGAAMDCNACHTSTTSFGSMTMNHNNSQGNGAGWCKGCHLKGTSYAGDMERKSLTHEKSSGVTDCSQSGCHRPLGNKGSTYKKWD